MISLRLTDCSDLSDYGLAGALRSLPSLQELGLTKCPLVTADGLANLLSIRSDLRLLIHKCARVAARVALRWRRRAKPSSWWPKPSRRSFVVGGPCEADGKIVRVSYQALLSSPIDGENVADCPIDYFRQDGHHERSQWTGEHMPRWSWDRKDANGLFYNWHPSSLGYATSARTGDLRVNSSPIACHFLRLFTMRSSFLNPLLAVTRWLAARSRTTTCCCSKRCWQSLPLSPRAARQS